MPNGSTSWGSAVHKPAEMEARMPLPVPVVRATPLYGIPPQGHGTGEIESLFGHLLALCFAQSLAPRQVVSRILPMVEMQMDGVPRRPRYQIGWAWDKHAGKEMIGMRCTAERWVQVLEAATGLTGLRATTLLPLEALTTGNLITDEERVCVECLADDTARGSSPYERLLWRLRPVTCCPIHRKRLLVPQCGRAADAAMSAFGRVKLSGVCRTCGSIGYTCRRNQPEPAADDEVWRAEQCLRVIAAMPSIEKAGPAAVRAAMRAHCAERGAISSLAFRSGAPKSVLTQWLKHEKWRLGFEQLLDICAVEELDLAALLQGQIRRAAGPGDLAPARVKRPRDRVDPDGVRRALEAALQSGRSVTDVARDLGVDLATLAKHRDLYVPVREASAKRRAEQEEARHLAAIQKVEAMARKVAQRGKRLTHRNAYREGSASFSPSSVESTVLSVMRAALGDRSAQGPATARKLGPRYLQRISEAAGRLRPEVGEAQMFLPFAPD